MDLSAYYYNYYYYNVPNPLPTYEFYPCVENPHSGTYDTQSNIPEGPLNLGEEQINYIEGEDETFNDPDSIPLPQELTKMFKPLECELCGVSVICHTSAFTHYEGKTHIKNVNAYMKEHYNVYGSLKVKKERFTPVRCDICNIELSSKVVYQQHFSGKQHLKNLKRKQYSVPMEPSYDMNEENDMFKELPPPPPPPKLSDYVCEVCGISTNTEQQMNFHKNGQKHKRKLAKLNEYKLDNALNSFYNNEWPEGSENGLFPDINDNSVSFIENPEMDYPLQFNDFPEDNNEVNENDGKLETENLDKKTVTDSPQEIIPSSLEPKTYELPVELGIENEKLISSTGVFLKQLSFVEKTINTKENSCEDNSSSKYNVSDGDSNMNLEIVQNSTENSSLSTQENFMSTESSAAPNEESKVISTEQILETNLDKTSSCSEKELKSPVEKLKTINTTTTNDELNKDSQDTDHISQDLKIPQNNNERTSDSISLEKENYKKDQVLTKLAIEEIEKESISYGQNRISKNSLDVNSLDVELSCTQGENTISKYKYDKAGYRINEEIASNKNDEKENNSDKRRYDNNVGNYYYKDRYGKRNYNYKWKPYDNCNNNNYKMYNNNYRNRDDRTNSYWRYYNRTYDKNNKRKRDESYYSAEEGKRDHRYDKDEERIRNHRYDKDEERKRDHRYDKDEERIRHHRYDRDEERRRDRHINDEEVKRYYKYDYGEKKVHNRYDKDEGRKRNKNESDKEQRYHKSRKSHKDKKKYSKHKTRRSSSRSGRQRSYDSDSSYSSRSRSKSSTDRDHLKKNKKTEKSSTRQNEKERKYKSSRRNNSDYSDSDSSSSSNSNSSNNHDYRLDQNGMCEKQHRCEKAYFSCPYKHEQPFKKETEIKRRGSMEKEESWNPEAPGEPSIEIKLEKEENTAVNKLDAALSAYRTSNGTYYCKYCIVSTKSNELFREHLQTPKHTLLEKFKNKI